MEKSFGRLSLNPSKAGPSVAPKPKKAQPQVPVVPKSHAVQSNLEPSYSTLLNAPPPFSEGSNLPLYANLEPFQNESSGDPIYTNLRREAALTPHLGGVDEEDLPLPPPPPPPPVSSNDMFYFQHPPVTSHDDVMHFPPPPPPGEEEEEEEEFASPPSPVSSSYSELRRAVGSTSGSANYAPLSQSSNYESLYEPIQPRALSPSAMSSLTRQSGYSSPYPAYSGGSSTYPTEVSQKPPSKEAEVDALTSLLVQSMDNAADPEFFGMCAECGLKVVGEGTGCTAMDRVFHIACFICRVCGSRLQGKPFYAVEGEPHCEECYLNTLERCCVCTEPILDRILRATGKPYHPHCFTCVVCGQCLDGIPFTVDAANRIHCISDFHKKFAPKCSVCQEPIMPEPGEQETVRVVALDRSFHVKCYKCEDCGLVLSSETEGRGCYPLDGHILCKGCNAARVQVLTRVTTEL